MKATTKHFRYLAAWLGAIFMFTSMVPSGYANAVAMLSADGQVVAQVSVQDVIDKEKEEELKKATLDNEDKERVQVLASRVQSASVQLERQADFEVAYVEPARSLGGMLHSKPDKAARVEAPKLEKPQDSLRIVLPVAEDTKKEIIESKKEKESRDDEILPTFEEETEEFFSINAAQDISLNVKDGAFLAEQRALREVILPGSPSQDKQVHLQIQAGQSIAEAQNQKRAVDARGAKGKQLLDETDKKYIEKIKKHKLQMAKKALDNDWLKKLAFDLARVFGDPQQWERTVKSKPGRIDGETAVIELPTPVLAARNHFVAFIVEASAEFIKLKLSAIVDWVRQLSAFDGRVMKRVLSFLRVSDKLLENQNSGGDDGMYKVTVDSSMAIVHTLTNLKLHPFVNKVLVDPFLSRDDRLKNYLERVEKLYRLNAMATKDDRVKIRYRGKVYPNFMPLLDEALLDEQGRAYEVVHVS